MKKYKPPVGRSIDDQAIINELKRKISDMAIDAHTLARRKFWDGVFIGVICFTLACVLVVGAYEIIVEIARGACAK